MPFKCWLLTVIANALSLSCGFNKKQRDRRRGAAPVWLRDCVFWCLWPLAISIALAISISVLKFEINTKKRKNRRRAAATVLDGSCLWHISPVIKIAHTHIPVLQTCQVWNSKSCVTHCTHVYSIYGLGFTRFIDYMGVMSSDSLSWLIFNFWRIWLIDFSKLHSNEVHLCFLFSFFPGVPLLCHCVQYWKSRNNIL